LPGRVKCGGAEVEIVVAHGCQKRKKLICGTEGEIVVAHGRLPSPAPSSAMALVRCPDLFHLILSFLIQPFMFSII